MGINPACNSHSKNKNVLFRISYSLPALVFPAKGDTLIRDTHASLINGCLRATRAELHQHGRPFHQHRARFPGQSSAHETAGARLTGLEGGTPRCTAPFALFRCASLS